MNQGKLEVVKQEMASVNNILGISELKWTGMVNLNSDDHYVYYCGRESLRRTGVATRVNTDILGISELNGQEWVNLTQMTIIFTTVGKNPLEEME